MRETVAAEREGRRGEGDEKMFPDHKHTIPDPGEFALRRLAGGGGLGAGCTRRRPRPHRRLRRTQRLARGRGGAGPPAGRVTWQLWLVVALPRLSSKQDLAAALRGRARRGPSLPNGPGRRVGRRPRASVSPHCPPASPPTARPQAQSAARSRRAWARAAASCSACPSLRRCGRPHAREESLRRPPCYSGCPRCPRGRREPRAGMLLLSPGWSSRHSP